MVVLNRPKYGQTQKQNVGSKEKANEKSKIILDRIKTFSVQ